MSKPVLFFANLCPDTAPFVAELARLEVDYESVEIMSSMANFKRFLTLRDQHPAFEQAKGNGYIGIPALLWADEQVVLDIHQLKDIFG
ncbi:MULTISPECIES: hypothetical protein [Pasteurella]|uniref:Glutaredoxin-related protein n=1 Tax=Pasteurella multocida (strain Pm70) TaxID=272843 RepID=Q9CLV3_PASMU|nr:MULTISPECIES: hypothetical protein [Pasteurella]EGP04700.1 glutaredoxin-related protein [Pasteurella multocida subsp. multocida str. Anand1_goat]AAK03183.1 unknown [Pasteurella multocida subsp. multocida str. Pm70]AMM80941.1 hypothetical protein AW43_00305 [Pasteurella multocida subsp. multocida PMTB2.1]APW54650.1 Glutaredoxin-related protein [Pasteurella multocida subsp. multocida str. HN07]APW57646.1 hypothetical protein BV212_05445 [Pasteurella multocida]